MSRRCCSRRVRRYPVVALWLVFFLNGAVLASWAPRIPEVKARLGLSDAELGIALFGVAAGSVPALLLTDRLLRRVSARTVCLSSATAFAAALPLVPIAWNAVSLGLTLALLGAASGALDVAMNTAGIEYQHRTSIPIVSRLHGGYSLGVLAGAAGGALATVTGVPIVTHFGATAVVLLVLLGVTAPHLPAHGHARSSVDAAPAHRVPLRSAMTVATGAIAIAGLLLEGMLTDWSALLVSRDFGAGIPVGSTVVVAFSFAMFVSRSVGDWTLAKLGRGRYLVITAIIAAAGTSIGLLVPWWGAAYVGVVAVGLVLGPAFPLAIDAAAERNPGAVSAVAAAVSAVGYFAYLGGPPLVGLVAHRIGLPSTVAVFGAGCALALVAVRRRVGR